MAASYNDDSITPSKVGSYFVGQYYYVLRQQPDFAHQFYNDKSTMTRVDGDASTTASTLLEIHSLLTSLNFTSVEIKTINSLESWQGGILVMTCGDVRSRDFQGEKKFTQTCFLAPQENGYFVLNEIFHLTADDPDRRHVTALSADPALDDGNIDPPPVPDYVLEEEAAQYVTSVHINNAADRYSLPDEEPPEEDHSPAYSAPRDSWSVAAEEPAPAKKTYASILRVAAHNPPPPPKSTIGLPETAAASAYVAADDAVEDGGFVMDDDDDDEGDEGLKSVYVRNLPSAISTAEIEQEFRHFGRLRHDGVFIRSRKDIGFCYAFVEFEDMQGVQKAIKASPIHLAGRQVFIEERRANSGGGSSSRARGRGRGARGGYPSSVDGSRGRVGSRGVGRLTTHDGSDFSRSSRGNGFYHRGSRLST